MFQTQPPFFEAFQWTHTPQSHCRLAVAIRLTPDGTHFVIVGELKSSRRLQHPTN